MKLSVRQVSEIIVFCSILISLLFVGYELRLARNIASTESSANAGAIQIELRSLITDNSEIWQQGCIAGDLSESESLVFAQIVQTYNSWAFTRWAYTGGGVSGLSPIQPPLEVALNMQRFPGFNATWELVTSEQAATHPIRLGGTSGSGWTQEVKRIYELLLETDLNPNTDIRLCGI